MSVLSPSQPTYIPSLDGLIGVGGEGRLGVDRSSSQFVRPTPADRVARKLVLPRLRLTHGAVRFVDAEGEFQVGVGTPAIDINVLDPQFYRCLLLGGSLGAGDAYVRGYWQCEDLLPLMRLLARNAADVSRVDSAWSAISNLAGRLTQWTRRNSRSGSRRNIHAHYDLSNEFFSLFLDETMTYSSGLFASASSTLREASLAKYERACQQLRLASGDHVLEVGCGWGGFAEYAAREYGCRVTGVTISQRQLEYAQRRIAAAGLADRVELRFCDYRDLDGQFDKIASIEMIEAVGHEYLPAFFRSCAAALRPDGLMFLQAITIPDQRYDRYRRRADFIQKYIFPGGCLPSLGVVSAAVKQTDFTIIEHRDFAEHYGRTLVAWRRRFSDVRDQVLELGFDETFLRTWEYYLCYCAAGFFERQIGLSQMLLARSDARCHASI